MLAGALPTVKTGAQLVGVTLTSPEGVTVHTSAILLAPVVSSETTAVYVPVWVSVNELKVNAPLLSAVVRDVAVVPLGAVMVAVTPPVGIAP
jgi:hypothetical protein